MKAIVCVDEKWGIGKNNDLLFSIPADMKFFREKTLGKVIIMGSNTLKSFPGGKPLKNRTNIVLFPGGEKRDDCLVVGSMEELFAAISVYPADDVFVVGGAMFYRTMLPYCSEVYVTRVKEDGGAEVFFADLDKLPDWQLKYVGADMCDNGHKFNFTTYANNAVKKLDE